LATGRFTCDIEQSGQEPANNAGNGNIDPTAMMRERRPLVAGKSWAAICGSEDGGLRANTVQAMRNLTADLFISLDGFASGIHEEAYFGYDGPGLSGWVQTETSRPQTILMGRKTYVALAHFAAEATDPNSVQLRALPKLVFSNTLKEPLTWNNTRVIAGELAQQIGELKQQAGDPIRTFGSPQLVKGLMQLGLVDRLRLMVFPLILGDAGREFIYAEFKRTALQLVGTKVLDARLILLEYEPQNRGDPA
jgi:dihydrofolate reductase